MCLCDLAVVALLFTSSLCCKCEPHSIKKMAFTKHKNTYTKSHPWRCDRTDYRPGRKKPSLCVANRKRFATGFHQEGIDMALAHCLAENESAYVHKQLLSHLLLGPLSLISRPSPKQLM